MFTVTHDTYTVLDKAFQYFNKSLFGDQLTAIAITLQRKSSAKGYFQADVFENREGEKANEIALNPDIFLDRTDEEILSTLVHEMCHHWQALYGEPSRNGYHNSEFACKMAEVGLICSSTGATGGKKTRPGQNGG
ncbi:MAG: SprT-like domain-containing protein [Aggregatilineales bacterium]